MNPQNIKPGEEPPPLFKSWTIWYLLVLFNLVALVGIFYLITQIFE